MRLLSFVCLLLGSLALCNGLAGPNCQSDTLFLVDSTGSVASIFAQEKEFVQKLLNQLDPEQNRVALIVYSSRYRHSKLHGFHSPQTKAAIAALANNIPFHNGVTMTGAALTAAIQELEKRRSGPANLVVITDGFSFDRVTNQTAELQKISGLRTFAVSVGQSYQKAELLQIAGSADRVFVGPDSIDPLVKALELCAAPATKAPVPPPTSTIAPPSAKPPVEPLAAPPKKEEQSKKEDGGNGYEIEEKTKPTPPPPKPTTQKSTTAATTTQKLATTAATRKSSKPTTAASTPRPTSPSTTKTTPSTTKSAPSTTASSTTTTTTAKPSTTTTPLKATPKSKPSEKKKAEEKPSKKNAGKPNGEANKKKNEASKKPSPKTDKSKPPRKPEEFTDVPSNKQKSCVLDVVFVLDVSSSVNAAFEQMCDAAVEIYDILTNGGHSLHYGVVRFSGNHRSKVVIPMGEHNSTEEFRRGLHTIRSTGGTTYIVNALKQVQEMLHGGADHKTLIVVITDGFIRDDSEKDLSSLKSKATVFLVPSAKEFPLNRAEFKVNELTAIPGACLIGWNEFQKMASKEKYAFLDRDMTGIKKALGDVTAGC
ncbi:VWFA domain-containing protein [Aphelenchoides fujianensis]|nr:VWFA domain-containing protein [Aphelenchoides fujianensis]